jgi:hypothetical protein
MRREIIRGKVERLLTNSASEVNGMTLDSGWAIGFPPERAREVLQIVRIGSLVEIQASVPLDWPLGWPANMQVDATLITDQLSGNCVALGVFSSHAPEVRAEICPPPGTAWTPLAPPHSTLATERDKRARAAIPEKATQAVERAYDRLYRCQTMLAFLKRSIRDQGEVLQYLHEAKKTYLQALGRYQSWDFEGACECAAACDNLANMVEILVRKTFDSLSFQTDLRRESSGPASETVEFDGNLLYDNLNHTESMLGRIHWITSNGTLPTEDREQVLKLVSWSEHLKHWASLLQDIGADPEACQFARAANAAAGAAEHVCKKCYVTRYAEP